MKVKYINPNAPEISFTITEVIPELQKFLIEQYNCHIMIQFRYKLTKNRLKFLEEPTYHLSIEYYAHPFSTYILLPHNITWNDKLCKLSCNIQYTISLDPMNIDKIDEISLNPMDIDEIDEMEQREKQLQKLIKKEDIMWIATEERDLTIEELNECQNWKSQKISFKERDINSKLLTPIITAYTALQPQDTIDADPKRKVKAIESHKNEP